MTRLFRPDAVDVFRQNPVETRAFLRYSAWDYNAMKDHLVEYVRENFGDEFNDFAESDYGIMLLELVAYASDLLSFKIDALLGESFLLTARQRKSVTLLAKTLGYQARGKTSAIARVSATLSAPYPRDVVISAGTRVSVSAASEDGGGTIVFELYSLTDDGSIDLESDITIPTGQLTNTSIAAVEGSTVTQTSTSDGSHGLRIRVQDSEAVESWIAVFVDGEEWERVSYLSGIEKQCVVEQDPDGVWSVVFGDGRNGAVPPVGSTVTVSYRVGGGPRGNVARGYINKVVNVLIRDTASGAPVTIYNYERGSGGADAQSLDDVKKSALASFRSRDRAVTTEDYVSLAESFLDRSHGKIAKASCSVRHAACSANVVDLYVIAVQNDREFAVVSDSLKLSLKRYLEERKCLTHRLTVRDASVVRFSVSVTVRSQRSFGRGAIEIESAVKERLERDFSTRETQIGISVKKPDVVRSLSQLVGIEFVDASFAIDKQYRGNVSDDVSVENWEIPELSSVSVNVILA